MTGQEPARGDLDHVPGESAQTAAARPTLRVDIFTLFPAMFVGPFGESIIKRAQERGLLSLAVHDIRDWTTDRHRTADDTPYGGGAGMVMTAPPIVSAVEETLGAEISQTRIVLLSAGGRLFNQERARDFAQSGRIAFICGHYEGIDERVAEVLNAEQFSIGEYVLTGGELPAMVAVDAITRLIPGVIDAASVSEESHEEALVEYPHYTRPHTFRERSVPNILLSGHHANIARWRREQAILRTARSRQDLLAQANLSPEERVVAENARSEPV